MSPQQSPRDEQLSNERSEERPRLPGRSRRRLVIFGLLLAASCGALLGFGVLGGHPIATSGETGHAAHASAKAPEHHETVVKVVRPLKDPDCQVMIERIATVEPYYRADLRARASGLVERVYHDIGETVKQGEVLIEIDVSEWEQEVAQKAALVAQREFELKVSQAKYRNAEAALEVTAATIRQKQAEVESITATRDFKKRKLDRYRDLVKKGNVTGNVVEEEERDLLASEGALHAAEANVERASADHDASRTEVESFAADVDLKRSQIEVAKKDLERAKVVADYGKVIAPFDGVIVRRNVDPGSFVQNATTGNSEVLISLARIDLLTVAAQIPDNAAPYVHAGVPAIIILSDFPGQAISANVTRFSPSIQNSDRTMRVEIDLFNGSAAELRRLEKMYRESRLQGVLKDSDSNLPVAAFADDPQSVGGRLSGKVVTGSNADEAAAARRMLPGMNGSVRLALGGGEAYVLPSSAVYSRSGTKYILAVVDGRAHELPVQIHLNDGRKVHLSVISGGESGGKHESQVLRELTGEELIAVANQLQIANGTKVRVAVTEW